MTTARRAVVHGTVQGVFFRASTRDLAGEHGVTGWVRNDPAGTVTMHLEGADDDVAAILAWVRRGGPPHAEVADLEVQDATVEGHGDFSVVG